MTCERCCKELTEGVIHSCSVLDVLVRIANAAERIADAAERANAIEESELEMEC